MTETAVAHLIGLYNNLVLDVGPENGIVSKIRQAYKKSGIDDKTVH